MSPKQGAVDGHYLFILGTTSVPASRGRSQEAVGHGEKVFVPLKETSVESFLRAVTPSLAKLQVPREQLLEVLEQIHSGSCGTLYHAKMTTMEHPNQKSVVLKALEGKVGNLFFSPFHFFAVNIN